MEEETVERHKALFHVLSGAKGHEFESQSPQKKTDSKINVLGPRKPRHLENILEKGTTHIKFNLKINICMFLFSTGRTFKSRRRMRVRDLFGAQAEEGQRVLGLRQLRQHQLELHKIRKLQTSNNH